jgi:inhibitor of the pro-sigma K processing machinery
MENHRDEGKDMKKFCVRVIVGACLIYFANVCLSDLGLSIAVGLNFLTLLTSGILGIPGVFLLYGIQAIQFL